MEWPLANNCNVSSTTWYPENTLTWRAQVEQATFRIGKPEMLCMPVYSTEYRTTRETLLRFVPRWLCKPMRIQKPQTKKMDGFADFNLIRSDWGYELKKRNKTGEV